MEALAELCDLIATDPTQFSDKLTWLCSRCPPPSSTRVTSSHLNAVVAVARFLSKSSSDHHHHKSCSAAVISFLRDLTPLSLSSFSFWPQSIQSISKFYTDLFTYVSISGDDVSSLAADITGEIVVATISGRANSDHTITMAFLRAIAKSGFVPVNNNAADRFVSCLLDNYLRHVIAVPGSPSQSSAQGSPMGGSGSGGGVFSPRGGDEVAIDTYRRRVVAGFEEESVEGLEKAEIAFELIGLVLGKGIRIEPRLLDQVRAIAKDQLHSMPAFLKMRKRDWTEQGALLKARINTKLSIYQAAAKLKVKSIASLEADGKTAKKLLVGTHSLLVDAAEACLISVWRKLRACEELFSSLVSGISQISLSREGQLLRVLLIRLKPLVLATCAQCDTWAHDKGAMFGSVLKMSCEIIEYGWSNERPPVETFISGLAKAIRERNDFEEEEGNEKWPVPVVQLNVIRLLADLTVSVKKPEVVDMILPAFIECLEEGDASDPSLLRLRLLDAISCLASLGFEKSYRETIVLLTRSYLCKLSSIGSAESKTQAAEATTERVETIPAGFLVIATSLSSSKMRADFRYRLLSLCSDVGLAAESQSGRSGADFLGPLLPAVAEICSDFVPSVDVEPSLLKLFRNLWFYIALFGLAPPIQKSPQAPTKSVSTTLNSVGSMGVMALQAVGGPYMWNVQWSSAVQQISQGTPPLVVSSVKWLEDELELNALHNPGSRRASGNEKAATTQRSALSAALGGRVEVAAMNNISGVKATYLLAVAFMEIIRFSSNGGILNGETSPISAFSCVFEYLKTPNLMPAVSQCLTAIVHQAFDASILWMDERTSETGDGAEARELTLSAHACFLIKSMSLREENIRDISVNLLSRLRDKFPQILWNSACLDSLLFSVHHDPPSAVVHDPAWVATVRSLYQKIVREWIVISLSHAPCTSQGLLQEKLCKANTWQKTQPATDVVSLLSEIRIGTGKSDNWSGTKTANIAAVIAAAAAASGANFKLMDAFNLEVLSTGVISATAKCNYAGEIAGMRRLYESIGGIQPQPGFGLGLSLQKLTSGVFSQATPQQNDSFNEIMLTKFVRLLQQFVNIAEKGGAVDKSTFRVTCSQATALLLSNLESVSKANIECFSKLLRLLCWCPAYVSTPDAMETGIFIWTWLVSAAPQLGSLVLAELVDAWLWTIDTKRGLFASEVRYSGPPAKLRPHLAPGEPELPPGKDPVEQIIAHRLWLGFFIDRFEVVRHDSFEQLLLLGRMIQVTTKLPWNFSRHPAATGTFFTFMLFGLKFCSCQSQGNLQSFKTGLLLLEDRIYRASLGWFANEPEWYDVNNINFGQSEAQSVAVFVHYLLNESADAPQLDLKARGRENGSSLADLKDQYHPVWGHMENYTAGREKRKQLLLMLCQHEADRLDVWAQPMNSNSKENAPSRSKVTSEKWVEYIRTAFSVDPRIALSLAFRFPTNTFLKAEMTQLVQSHITELRCIPEALPYFVTPKSVDENSTFLQQLPHWAACSITQALEFLTPSYKGHPRVMAYVLRVLESYPPDRVTFFMPQLVQALRYDDERLVEGYLLRAAQRSDTFAHILIWHLQGETVPETGKDAGAGKNSAFLELLPVVRQRIVDGFTTKARDLFQREFDFFDKVTSISGVLFPLPKEERRAGIRRELEKIEMDGNDLYLPTAPNKLVRGIRVDSGIPLQSAAKVPIMITFNVVDRDGDPDDIKPQACIFKVSSDTEEDTNRGESRPSPIEVNRGMNASADVEELTPDQVVEMASKDRAKRKADKAAARRAAKKAKTSIPESKEPESGPKEIDAIITPEPELPEEKVPESGGDQVTEERGIPEEDISTKKPTIHDTGESVPSPRPKVARVPTQIPSRSTSTGSLVDIRGKSVQQVADLTGATGIFDPNPGAGLLAMAALQQFPTDLTRMETSYSKMLAAAQTQIPQVGDDCRQDVLALQVISLLKGIFEAVGINLYLFPYGVLPTGPERGIIEVVPNTRSRSQMGETTDGGLYEIFQQDFGPVGTPSFETARENFIISSAGYAVASLLIQPKDRHNGNLLFDNFGRLVHIDFGFILETSPGGNMRFESAHFKVSHEMTQLLDPSGVMKSETWYQFVSLTVKGYLAARRHMDGIINTVLMMKDSGLPCFSRGDPIGNLRKRFHPEMSDREAANFMIRTCTDSYNSWTTAGYDLIQFLQQGIEK